VTVLERTNARELDPTALPYRPDLVVADVSFISLTLVLGPALAAAQAPWRALLLVKPQFEAGRERIGKGGVVRDAGTRAETVAAVAEAARGDGLSVMGFAPSDLPGPAGNKETFVWLAEAGRAGAVGDIGDAVLAVAP
jgi:23S rRNA (cytidine1920-2'-O)/16S rRNA (cytidine1409-2'-O)-methyltransferase